MQEIILDKDAVLECHYSSNEVVSWKDLVGYGHRALGIPGLHESCGLKYSCKPQADLVLPCEVEGL